MIVETLDDLAPYLSDGWLARLRMGEFAMPRSGPHPGAELEFAGGQGGADPERAAAELADGTTHAILIPSQPLVSSGWLGHRMAAVFAAAVNDYVVGRWLPADERFRFAISVAAHDGDVAAEEIHRIGSHPAAVAVCFSPIAVNLGQAHYQPIYEAAAEHGLAVIVHPGGFEGNVVGPAALGGVGPADPRGHVLPDRTGGDERHLEPRLRRDARSLPRAARRVRRLRVRMGAAAHVADGLGVAGAPHRGAVAHPRAQRGDR